MNEMLHYLPLATTDLTFVLSGGNYWPDGIEDVKLGKLPWLFVGLKSYFHYFVVYDLRNASKYRSFDYGMDWNATVLRSALDYKLKKNIHTTI